MIFYTKKKMGRQPKIHMVEVYFGLQCKPSVQSSGNQDSSSSESPWSDFFVRTGLVVEGEIVVSIQSPGGGEGATRPRAVRLPHPDSRDLGPVFPSPKGRQEGVGKKWSGRREQDKEISSHYSAVRWALYPRILQCRFCQQAQRH